MKRLRVERVKGVLSRYKIKKYKTGLTLTSAFYKTDIFEVLKALDLDTTQDELVQMYLNDTGYILKSINVRKFEKGFSAFIDFEYNH